MFSCENFLWPGDVTFMFLGEKDLANPKFYFPTHLVEPPLCVVLVLVYFKMTG